MEREREREREREGGGAIFSWRVVELEGEFACVGSSMERMSHDLVIRVAHSFEIAGV